jgi:hypothetical protein
MKKTILTVILLAPVSAALANPPNSAGCGLGSQVFDKQSGVGPQVLAVTTNGTSGNQTFGISSGTSGCDPHGTVVASARVPMFVGANLDSLAHDIAMGQGESLESLATVMGIRESDKAGFFSVTKENYALIFASANVTAADVLNSIYTVMAKDDKLAQYVRT